MLYKIARLFEWLAEWDRYVLTPLARKVVCLLRGHRFKDVEGYSVYQCKRCSFCGELRRVSETPIPKEYRV